MCSREGAGIANERLRDGHESGSHGAIPGDEDNTGSTA